MVDLRTLTAPELQQLLEDLPWFTVARREAIARQNRDDEEAFRRAIARDAVFFLSRDEIFRLLSGKVHNPEPVAPSAPAQPRYYVAGGDYFGQEDFDRLEKEGFSVSTPVFGAKAGSQDYAPIEQEEIDRDHIMVSETLAEIYRQQELYGRAVEIYEKLILLYPEKSAYFASLIEKVKDKKQ